MSLKGIDVSSYQGNIRWDKVKSDGIDFAILKVIRKDLLPDKKFYDNWNACVKNKIPVIGVYNYSYATTEEKARNDAMSVLKIMCSRKCTIWLDVEDDCQKNLGNKLIAIINAYKKVITDAGYNFGVYTGQSFYNSYIKPFGGLDCKLWIARYGKNDGILNTKYQPHIDDMIGWQYTSKGIVKGINCCVDMNVWYDELNAINAENTNDKCQFKEPSRLLKYGLPMMHGDDVKWVQLKLCKHKFMEESDIDGWFGKDTDKAVRLFQLSKKITPDGKVGIVTKKYLNS